LEENIRQGGNYETITVRPHPNREGDFQILNGHHRVEILRKMGVEEVKCDVWEVGDKQARLLVATLNRLRGDDVPELRFGLLRGLLDDYDPSELEALIPENDKQIMELLELNEKNMAELLADIEETTSQFKFDIPDIRIMDFFLNSEQYHLVTRALDHLMASANLKDRNEAVCEMARNYLN
jgi:ParB-like chromosome segregation protein Spo0J